MARFVPGFAVSLLLLSPAAAPANFWFGRPASVSFYYYPAPVYYVPAARVYYYNPCPVYTVPVYPSPTLPAPRVGTFAIPTPAPPSREPPLANPPIDPKPGVSESRFFDVYSVASANGVKPAGERCSVAFWNLSKQDLVLKVGGQRQVLGRGKSMTLNLDRQFVWQVEGREPQAEQVPANESALEIVIRK